MPIPTFRTPGRPIFKTANLLGDCTGGQPGDCIFNMTQITSRIANKFPGFSGGSATVSVSTYGSVETEAWNWWTPDRPYIGIWGIPEAVSTTLSGSVSGGSAPLIRLGNSPSGVGVGEAYHFANPDWYLPGIISGNPQFTLTEQARTGIIPPWPTYTHHATGFYTGDEVFYNPNPSSSYAYGQADLIVKQYIGQSGNCYLFLGAYVYITHASAMRVDYADDAPYSPFGGAPGYLQGNGGVLLGGAIRVYKNPPADFDPSLTFNISSWNNSVCPGPDRPQLLIDGVPQTPFFNQYPNAIGIGPQGPVVKGFAFGTHYNEVIDPVGGFGQGQLLEGIYSGYEGASTNWRMVLRSAVRTQNQGDPPVPSFARIKQSDNAMISDRWGDAPFGGGNPYLHPRAVITPPIEQVVSITFHPEP